MNLCSILFRYPTIQFLRNSIYSVRDDENRRTLPALFPIVRCDEQSHQSQCQMSILQASRLHDVDSRFVLLLVTVYSLHGSPYIPMARIFHVGHFVVLGPNTMKLENEQILFHYYSFHTWKSCYLS
jgi:hypothetical protein